MKILITKDEQIEELKLKLRPFKFDNKKLLARMEELGFLQKHLADLCGVTRASIGRIMEGVHLPSTKNLGIIAAALKVTPNFFFNQD